VRRALLVLVCFFGASAPVALAAPAGTTRAHRALVPAVGSGEYLVVRPAASSAIVLRDRPGGAVVGRLSPSTRFGGPRVLGVVKRSGPWLAVSTDALPNGRLGWVDARARLGIGVVQSAIRVSLSQRRLELLRGGRVVLRLSVAIGAAATPTPTGRFAVAEKLSGPALGAAYGCCILGLSAHQPHPPASWDQGRDWLVAIHGGGGYGAAVLAGCIHVDETNLRRLMAVVPLGTPVFIQG
jgi:lipoprotein-anchoring transpeptidase ErfK/SrfK